VLSRGRGDTVWEYDMTNKNDNDDRRKILIDMVSKRRAFITGSVAAGTVAALAGCQEPGKKPSPTSATGDATGAAAGTAGSSEVKPGQLDDYYGFWSGGQSGEVRIYGIPSMRELKRIPVFGYSAATGWGSTDWSKKALSGKLTGDTHHVHPSYKNGTYDGRYIFVNDKAQARLARIDIESMEVDHIVDLPNSDGTHGIFPQRHKTGYVFCNSEFRTPKPNDGTDMDDPTKYGAMHTAVDGETMEVKWQVLVEGNMDLCATDYEGNYSFATCYNSEGAVDLKNMMATERDHLYVFNIKNLEKAVKDGKTITVGESEVPVVDARGKDSEFVLRVPIPKSPHGVNVDPTGKYAIVSGKLSPTCSVVEIGKLASAFAGKIKPRDCVVAEPEVGLGPLHTAFDNKGNAYTSIFLDSVVTKWNIAKAIEEFKAEDKKQKKEGKGKSASVIQKLDVHYQIGHINATMSETKDADGKWLIALCKFSKDRFLNVGPLHNENDQLIDISGGKMRLVHDGPTYPEPHDAVMVRKDLIRPKKIQQRKTARFKLYDEWAKEDGIDLKKDNKIVKKEGLVRVYMTSMAPNFGMNEFKVKKGDTVQVILTNIDTVEDLSHGFCLSHHDVNFLCNAQDTQSETFKADRTGVWWYYCPWFCHALHLEMRGRMIVEA
jgi:nitrous-oxide reductase